MIVAITGASGAQIGYRVLEALREHDCEVHLIMSEGARLVIRAETDLCPSDFEALADFCYDESEMGAVIASGTFPVDGMIVAPCSMKTLAGIACAYDENLCIRAADVCLKENKRVVLIPRETPLRPAHLRNLLTVSEEGCSVVMPVLSFYAGAEDVAAQVDQIVGKALSQFGIEHSLYTPWKGYADDKAE